MLLSKNGLLSSGDHSVTGRGSEAYKQWSELGVGVWCAFMSACAYVCICAHVCVPAYTCVPSSSPEQLKTPGMWGKSLSET